MVETGERACLRKPGDDEVPAAKMSAVFLEETAHAAKASESGASLAVTAKPR